MRYYQYFTPCDCRVKNSKLSKVCEKCASSKVKEPLKETKSDDNSKVEVKKCTPTPTKKKLGELSSYLGHIIEKAKRLFFTGTMSYASLTELERQAGRIEEQLNNL